MTQKILITKLINLNFKTIKWEKNEADTIIILMNQSHKPNLSELLQESANILPLILTSNVAQLQPV